VTLRSAIIPFAVALGLMYPASALLVLGVGLARAPGNLAGAKDEAVRFSLSAAGLMSVALVNAIVLLSVALVSARRTRQDTPGTLRLGRSRASAAGVGATIAGMVGLSVACGSASELLGVRRGGAMDRVAHVLDRPTPAGFALAVVTIGLAPAFAEETFFRGLIQSRLTRRWSRWPSIVAASLGFGVMHGDLVQGSLMVVAGMFLGWCAERLDGVRPTIAAHAVNNTIFVALASMGSPEPGSRGAQAVLLAIGAAACAACVAVLRGPRAVRA